MNAHAPSHAARHLTVSAPTDPAPAPALHPQRMVAPSGPLDAASNRNESLKRTKWRLYSYLVLGVAWYVRRLPGGAGRARPLNLPPPLPVGRDAEEEQQQSAPWLPRAVAPFDNAAWARQGDLHVALGAGFVGGLYRHLGFLEALDDMGIKISELAGISGTSAGAIVAATCGALPLRGPGSVHEALMSLHPQDFLDPDWHTLRTQGVICSGEAFARKLVRTLGAARLEDLRPSVRIGVYDLNSGETHFIDSGPAVIAVRGSAALPMLYPPVRLADGRLVGDGGIVDQNCTSGMPPGRRAINHRIFDRTGSSVTCRLTSLRIGRPPMHLAPSADPMHKTLHRVPTLTIHELNFVDALQDGAVLAEVTRQAFAHTMAWLSEPATAPSRA